MTRETIIPKSQAALEEAALCDAAADRLYERTTQDPTLLRSCELDDGQLGTPAAGGIGILRQRAAYLRGQPRFLK